MERFLASAVEFMNLGAATEAVGEDDVVGRRLTDSWQENLLGAGLGDLEMSRLEAEVPGQTTAARVEAIDRRAGCSRSCGRRPSPDGVLMAVHLSEPVHPAEPGGAQPGVCSISSSARVTL